MLGLEDFMTIQALVKRGVYRCDIAEQLGVHPRTIRRALQFIENGVIQAADFVDGEYPLSGLPELFKSMAAGNRAAKTLIRVHE